jgi:uncharacterized protein (DUF58 family)
MAAGSGTGPFRPVDACDLRPFTVRRRLTDLGARMFSLGLVLGLLATVIGSRVLLGAGLAASLLPWLSLLTSLRPRLVVTADGPARTRVGGDALLRLRLVNAGRGRLPAVELRCVRPLFASVEGAIPALAAGASTTWEVSAEPLGRGVSNHLHVEVRATDAFGLSLQRHTLLVAARIAVAPRSVLLPAGVRPGSSASALDLGTLRAWRPGDGGATVAWRPTARRLAGSAEFNTAGALVVRERAQEEPDLVRLAITGGPVELAERALEVLAAATLDLLDSGRIVEVHLGGEPIRPARGELLLDTLAAVTTLPTTPPDRYDLLVACGPGPAGGDGERWVVDAGGRIDQR